MIKVINPATLEEIKQYNSLSGVEISSIIKKTEEVKRNWGELSVKEREKYLLKARDYLIENADDFARAISINTGKPLFEALSTEITSICSLLTYFGKNSHRILKPKSVNIWPWNLLFRTSKLYYQPKGIVCIISPWNFPFSIPVGQIAMALVAGNCVVHKPASATMYVGEWIDKLFNEGAGLPKGVFSTLYSDSSEMASILEAKVFNKISFTGSVENGRKVAESAAKTLTSITLELGGKDPMIVCEDANLKTAAKGAVWGAFFNCGQVCASVERLYVHERIKDKFIVELTNIIKKLRIGDGLENIDIGPLTVKSQLDNVLNQIEDAKVKGAKIITGGNKVNLKGYFFEPTLISKVDKTFLCVKEETFGPILPIMEFKTEEEAISLANDSRFALTASVWSKNIKKAKQIAKRIKAGTVTINEHAYTHGIAETPWGGLNDSGYGRSHGKEGLLDFTEIKHIHVNHIFFRPSFWWFGYNDNAYKNLVAILKNTSKGILGFLKIIPTLIKIFFRKLY